jgi:hypothetical protein
MIVKNMDAAIFFQENKKPRVVEIARGQVTVIW